MKIELLDFDVACAEVAVGEGDEQVVFTFRKTSRGIRKTATAVAVPDTSTWIPRTDFVRAYRMAVAAIVAATQEVKDPHFLKRKLGEK